MMAKDDLQIHLVGGGWHEQVIGHLGDNLVRLSCNTLRSLGTGYAGLNIFYYSSKQRMMTAMKHLPKSREEGALL